MWRFGDGKVDEDRDDEMRGDLLEQGSLRMMTLAEQLERSGTWLFRWRSFLPLPLLAVFVATVWVHPHPLGLASRHDWQGLCLAIGLVGFAIRVLVVAHAPRGTSGRNTRRQLADQLNTTGLYSVVRNPLYLGNFFMCLAPAMFAGIWWLVVIFVLSFWLYYERIIMTEETFLKQRFGGNFLEWARRTPAFVPSWRQYSKPELPFCWRTGMRRETDSLLGLVAVLFMLQVVAASGSWDDLRFDPAWVGILATTVAIWGVVRVLRRYTHMLDVEGR
jgi:protein-S-isoprenylcysteine O-methyltransferase Ste14